MSNCKTQKEGTLFIFSAPSGAGKSSIINQVKKDIGDIFVSISATTRPMREGEEDGRDYYFISVDEFNKFIAEDAFYEYVDSDFGPKYGTPKGPIEKELKAGKDVFMDLDYPGVLKMKSLLGDKIKTIFIMPPSIEELRNRLIRRNTDSLEVIERRMSMAEKRIGESKYYDFVVVNDNLERAIKEVEDIILKFRKEKAQAQEECER